MKTKNKIGIGIISILMIALVIGFIVDFGLVALLFLLVFILLWGMVDLIFSQIQNKYKYRIEFWMMNILQNIKELLRN